MCTQVSSLKSHHQQLLTALQAAEKPLVEAQQALEDHDSRRQQLETTLQQKTVALLQARREAKEQRRQAEQVQCCVWLWCCFSCWVVAVSCPVS
jgi:chromosome segregation ATPase